MRRVMLEKDSWSNVSKLEHQCKTRIQSRQVSIRSGSKRTNAVVEELYVTYSHQRLATELKPKPERDVSTISPQWLLHASALQPLEAVRHALQLYPAATLCPENRDRAGLRIRGKFRGCSRCSGLDLARNHIGDAGAEKLVQHSNSNCQSSACSAPWLCVHSLPVHTVENARKSLFHGRTYQAAMQQPLSIVSRFEGKLVRTGAAALFLPGLL